MTARELMRALLRRWYVVLLGMLVTAGAGFVMTKPMPVYYTHFEVVVLPPQEPPNPNTLRSGPYSLTPMAGVLVSDFNGGKRPLQMSESDTTIYGEGMRRGNMVRLRNAGTQWQPMFDQPVIDVQVVDPDPEQVDRAARMIAGRLAAILHDRQVALGVKPSSQMTLEQSPVDPVIDSIGGSRTRSAAAVLLIGGWMTLLAVYWTERGLARRRRRVRVRGGEPLVPPPWSDLPSAGSKEPVGQR